MAQIVNAQPVVLEQDNSMQYLANTLGNIAESKRRQQALLQDQLLKQKAANDKIFGDQVKNLQEWSAASKLPTVERDRILNEGIDTLIKNRNSPNFQALAPVLTTKAFQAYKGWDKYYADAEGTINDLAQQFNADPAKLKQFALANIYDYQQEGQDNANIIEGLRSGVIEPPAGKTRDQAIADAQAIKPKTVQKLKDATKVGDVASLIRDEFAAHPELYVDKNKVATGAFAELEKGFKALEKRGDKLTLDPTGTKTTTIGTEYTVSPFEVETEMTDKETGLKFRKPVLKTEQTTVITTPDGKPYEVLQEDAYQSMVGGDNKNTRQLVYTSALEKIREHNEKAFEKAGFKYPKATSLAVSRANASMFNEIPGYINPFDDASIEVFQRASALDILKGSGRYDDKGEVLGFKLDRGINKAKPNQGINISFGGPGMQKGYIDAWPQVVAAVDSGKKPLDELEQQVRDEILRIADNNTIFRVKGKKVLPDMITLGRDNEGRIRIFLSDKDGKPTGTGVLISEQGINRAVNSGLGTKTEGAAAAAGSPSQPTGKSITKAEFSKMSIAERAKFLSEGGTYK